MKQVRKTVCAALAFLLLLTASACSQTKTGAQTPSGEATDTVQTESVVIDTTEPIETEIVTAEPVSVTEPPAETDAVTPPVGYGSEVTAFDSIREMIEKINSGELRAGEQRIFDTYGCDTAQLRELTGLDEGFSETAVEWCGGFNYCINYGKDGQIIAFEPYYTDEQLNGALSGLESWDNLLKNELLLNLEKTEIPTGEGFMYECTFDTASVQGQRKTYHEFTGTDGIQRIVTNWYGADGTPISGRVYVFDGIVPFSCYIFGFEASMELAKRLGTQLVEDIVIGTVIYSDNGAINEIPTNIGYKENIVYQWQSDWFYGDVGYRVIRGSAAARMEQLLTGCKTTGDIAPKLSDVTVDRLDEIEGRLPCERGTLWLEVGESIYRKVPGEKTYALVDGYFGAGEYLEMDEQSQAELFDILEYWPRDYYSGTYKNGTLTMQHVYRGDSSLSAVVTGIQIDKKEGENNVITLALTAEHDMHISLHINIEVSSDHFLDGDIISLDLKAGQTQTVELPYIGFTNEFFGYTDEDYWIDIYTENLRIYLHIDP